MSVILDCGDNSCRFAKNKGGQRTNGGCRCLRSLDPIIRIAILEFISDLEGKLAACREQLHEEQHRSESLQEELKAVDTCTVPSGQYLEVVAKCDRLKEGLRKLEWSDPEYVELYDRTVLYCPVCGFPKDRNKHDFGCWLAELLK
jgi:hypothetical protein